MNPGELDTLIKIQRATTSANTTGDVVPAWSDVFELWSSKRFLKGRELTEARQIVAEVEAKFVVRYSSEVATLQPKDRINDHGELYDILESIPVPGGRPERFELLVKRRVG